MHHGYVCIRRSILLMLCAKLCPFLFPANWAGWRRRDRFVCLSVTLLRFPPIYGKTVDWSPTSWIHLWYQQAWYIRTFFELHCDIIQLAATYQQSIFNTYIMPSKEIDPRASQMTGLKLFKGKMYPNSREVITEPLQTALTQFLKWIPSKAPVLLVGHNCCAADAPRLLLKFKEYNLQQKLCDAVAGFMDTLPLFKDAYKLDNYQQKTIVNHVLNETYAAHDALADCQALEKAMAAADHHLKESRIDKFKYTFTSGTMVGKLRCDELKTQSPIPQTSSDTKATIHQDGRKKAASSGLQMRHLELAFRRNEDKGINRFFAENVTGKPCVTKDKKISQRVSEFFKSQMENWTHQTFRWLSTRLQ